MKSSVWLDHICKPYVLNSIHMNYIAYFLKIHIYDMAALKLWRSWEKNQSSHIQINAINMQMYICRIVSLSWG